MTKREIDDILGLADSRSRATALLDLGPLLSPEELNHALREWWTVCDCASSGDQGEELLELFYEAGYIASPDRTFSGPVTIYRANLGEDPRLGFSWTLSHAKADWFARYFADSPRARFLGVERADGGDRRPTVWTATIDGADVLAYFNDRNEHEVIVDPLAVSQVSSQVRLSPADASGQNGPD